MERLGVPRRIVAFVLPLGYSFNLDGTTLYLSLASIFVAQAAGVHLSVGQQITMLLTLMLTSKGVAGVPRASLVILAGTLASYGLPLEGVTLILGVDELMDMARTMVNVIGNCLATVVVAKWEGEFVEASDETARARGRARRDLIDRHGLSDLSGRQRRRFKRWFLRRASRAGRAPRAARPPVRRGGRSCASPASTTSRRSATSPASRSSPPARSPRSRRSSSSS